MQYRITYEDGTPIESAIYDSLEMAEHAQVNWQEVVDSMGKDLTVVIEEVTK